LAGKKENVTVETGIPLAGGGLRAIDLEQPRSEGMPVHPTYRVGYSYVLHRRHEDGYRPGESGPRAGASGMLLCTEHSGTHVDALCHQSEDLRLFGGIEAGGVQTPKGFTRLGAETIPPLVAPGVLADVAASKGLDALEPGYPISAEDLRACLDEQGARVAPGDVVLVRTGSGRHWGEPDRYLAGAGVSAGASRWLAERGVLAVGADNVAWDVLGPEDPELGCQLPGHLILLVRHGVYIVENLRLEELAASGHRRFLFVCAPPKLVGATGSPARPLAIVS